MNIQTNAVRLSHLPTKKGLHHDQEANAKKWIGRLRRTATINANAAASDLACTSTSDAYANSYASAEHFVLYKHTEVNKRIKESDSYGWLPNWSWWYANGTGGIR
jgi:hypothetical protein